MQARYEVRIAHALDDEVAAAFEGLGPTADGEVTRLRGELDQAALHGVLERIRVAGYELIDARREGEPATTHTYEIRIAGVLGPAARQAFADIALDVEPASTVLTVDVGQCELHALLDRVRALGLELLDVVQAGEASPMSRRDRV